MIPYDLYFKCSEIKENLFRYLYDIHYFYLFNHRLQPNNTSFEFTALYIAKPIRSTSVITEKENKNKNIRFKLSN